jgi:hypothetical protein
MKKIILVFALLFSLLTCAQNFPGEQVELLAGKSLIVLPVKESLQKYGYRGFYKDVSLKKIYKKEGTTTAYTELADKEFKVVSYEPYTNSIRDKKFKLLIENPETGQVYYDYDPRYSSSFPFKVVGGLDYPKDFFCNKIYEKDMKSVSKSTWYAAPAQDGMEASLSKSEKGNFLFLHINVPTSEKYASGVIRRGAELIFADGTSLSMPDEELKSQANPFGSLLLSVTLGLNKPKYLELIQEKVIVSVKLNKYESEIKEGFSLQQYFKCLIGRMEAPTAATSAPATIKNTSALCSQITVKSDEAKGKIMYDTPFVDGLSIEKMVSKDHTTYIGTAEVLSETEKKGLGISLLFENGDFLSKPDAKVFDGGMVNGKHKYVALFLIEEDKMEYFKNSPLKGWQVRDVTRVALEAKTIQQLADCLINK